MVCISTNFGRFSFKKAMFVIQLYFNVNCILTDIAVIADQNNSNDDLLGRQNLVYSKIWTNNSKVSVGDDKSSATLPMYIAYDNKDNNNNYNWSCHLSIIFPVGFSGFNFSSTHCKRRRRRKMQVFLFSIFISLARKE